MLKPLMFALAVGAFSPANAASTSASQITLVGVGSVETPPDIATLTFDVVGEGATAELATRALVAKNKSVEDGLSGIAGKFDLHTGAIVVKAVRGKECEGFDGDNAVVLNSGACSIKGYVAKLSFVVRLSPADAAGTATGQAARFGASNANVEAYSLSDPVTAQRKAEQLAVADAKARALAIAQGSGRSLGSLLRVEDTAFAGVETQRLELLKNGPPPSPVMAPPPPVVVGMKPAPITTEARLLVTFELLP